jgi:hypothetical protein
MEELDRLLAAGDVSQAEYDSTAHAIALFEKEVKDTTTAQLEASNAAATRRGQAGKAPLSPPREFRTLAVPRGVWYDKKRELVVKVPLQPRAPERPLPAERRASNDYRKAGVASAWCASKNDVRLHSMHSPQHCSPRPRTVTLRTVYI